MPRHPFDLLSFIFGSLFVGIGLLLLGGNSLRDSVSLVWLGPIVAVGLAVLIVLAAGSRATDDPRADIPDDSGGSS